MLILKLLQLLSLISLTRLESVNTFSNVVKYPTISPDNVYKFELHVTDGITMAVQKHKTEEFPPVDYNITDRHFYRRSTGIFEACDASSIVIDENELATIIVGTGIHRPILMFNRQFPGPSIVVPKDAKMEITVYNHLKLSAVSVHWHGQNQKGTFQMDGVTRITQCPIMPGDHFIYKFTAREVGTHWYHSHSSAQRTDGLVGAFIVVDPSTYAADLDDPNNLTYQASPISSDSKPVLKANPRYQSEFLLFVQDFMSIDSETAVSYPLWGNAKFWNGFEKNKTCFTFLRILDGSLISLRAESVIINGKSWHTLPTFINHLDTFNTTASALPIERFKVQPNSRYLFRVVGSNMGFPIVISVNGHKMTLVASDGNPLKPVQNLDYFIINGGERYDFEVETKSSSESNFYVIAKILPSFDVNNNPLPKDYYGISILDYNASGDALTFVQPTCSPGTPCRMANCPFKVDANPELECVNVGDLHASGPQEEEARLFKTKYSESEFEEKFFNVHFAGSPPKPSLSGKQYKLPNHPPFFTTKFEDSIKGIECPANCTGEATCKCSQLTPLTRGKVIQLTVYNMGFGSGLGGTSHPIHLHGFHFHVIKLGLPEYNAAGKFVRSNTDIACFNESYYCNDVGWSNPDHNMGNVPNANLVDPPKKDSVIVPIGGYVVIRFIADNIGYWFFHCHIEVHTVEGMSTLMQVGTHEEIRQTVDWDNLNTCARGFERIESPKSKIRYDIAFYVCLSLAIVFLISTLALYIQKRIKG